MAGHDTLNVGTVVRPHPSELFKLYGVPRRFGSEVLKRLCLD